MIQLDINMKMPDRCSLCCFFRVESQMYCTAVVGYTTVNKPYKRRPAWCPLHEADSDTISRQQAIDALKEAFNPSITNFVKAKLAIENLPSSLLANKSPKVDKEFGELISRRDDNS